MKVMVEHIESIDLSSGARIPLLNLKEQPLSYGLCEALEEVFKRVQYKCIDMSSCGLDDVSAGIIFDMVEYYEATNELDISDNNQITNKGWLSCINMVKKSQALQVLSTRGTAISDHHAQLLAQALNTSTIHTLKLEHCGLGRADLSPIIIFYFANHFSLCSPSTNCIALHDIET
jgi:protein phosphatase 1 regulatory subunit 37